MRGEALVGRGTAQACVQDQELMKKRCPASPVPDDEHRRIVKFGFGKLAGIEEMLNRGQQRVDRRRKRDGKGHQQTRRVDPKMAVAQ